jgi:hypothetical protein
MNSPLAAVPVSPSDRCRQRLEAIRRQLSWSVHTRNKPPYTNILRSEVSASEGDPEPPASGEGLEPKEQFRYKDLSDGDDARLLVLQPGQFGEILRGEIKHVTSLQREKYEALSYSWGKRTDAHEIILNAGFN